MTSSGGGGGDGGYGMMLRGGNPPMPGLPIAGAGSNVDPYSYGQFQNFLPDIKAEGQNDMATGLRPEMFEYHKPGGGVAGDSTTGGDTDKQIQELRDQLAKLQTSGGGAGGAGNTLQSENPGMLPIGFNTMSPEQQQRYGTQGFMGGIGTMGMGGGLPRSY